MKHPARSAKRPLSGLTLLEVVAAIAILGTILVGLVLAKARHVRQLAEARRLSAAVRAADSLLADWWTRPEGVPDNESGPVGTDGSLVYATREVPSAAIERLTCRVVRVEIRQAAREVPGAETPDEPLVAVELVLPRVVALSGPFSAPSALSAVQSSFGQEGRP